MIDYIWFNDKSPLLNQLPVEFKWAAIILHPFHQMPPGWADSKSQNGHERPFLSDEELLKNGKPITWETVRQESGMASLEEVGIALKTYIGALSKGYARSDLDDKLISYCNRDLYYPDEDTTSVLLMEDLLKVLGSKGARKLIYTDPLQEKKGTVEIQNITPLNIKDLALKEMIIADENMDFAYMSRLDSFITILMARENTLKEIVEAMKFEALLCDENTNINWCFPDLYK